jgi:hypothetical protein
MGRFLSWLLYFGEDWLKQHIEKFFPADDQDLLQATWRSFLCHDQGPRVEFMDKLHDCYAHDIALLGSDRTDKSFRDYYQERLADHLMTLYLWDALPEDRLLQFWKDAPVSVRQHAMCNPVGSPPGKTSHVSVIMNR